MAYGESYRFFLKYRFVCICIFFFLFVQFYLFLEIPFPSSTWTFGGPKYDEHHQHHFGQQDQGHQHQGHNYNSKFSYPEKWFIDDIELNLIHNKFLSKSLLEETKQVIRNEEIYQGKVAISDSTFENDNKLSENNSSLLKLDIESLPIVPDCNITLKESISAITRAKTSQCKEQLIQTSCKIVQDTLYPKKLPRFCKNDHTTYMKYLGCFKDEPNNRILSDHVTLLNNDNSPSKCTDLCLRSGYMYAGLQYSVECFCGNKIRYEHKYPKEKCNMKCSSSIVLTSTPDPNKPTNVNKNCGGYFAIDIYETGIFHDLEAGKKLISLDDIAQMKNSHNNNKLPTKTVRIVFFLTLNGRSFRQILRLFKTIFHERHYFLIHVDSRQDYLYRKLLILEEKLPNNVRFMSKRYSAIWGGASLLQVLLTGMAELVTSSKNWNWNWDYIINLSESDFPLKTTSKLEDFLSYNLGKNFVKSHGKDVQKFIQKQGLDKTFDECEFRMWRLGDRVLPEGIVIDGGSDWIGLHRHFVEYLVTSRDELVEGLKIVFNYTLLPAETFFHTVLKNSEHCGTCIDNNLKVTNWKRKLGCKCQYRNVVDWCGCSPNDFRTSDWNKLQLSENRLIFFGRKFECVVNQGIVNNLERWLYPDQFISHSSTIDKYWQSLYHNADLIPPDDTLLTLGHSLSRLAAIVFNYKFLKQDYDNQDLSSNNNGAGGASSIGQDQLPQINIKLIEITSYHHLDELQGILIRYENHIDENLIIPMETWFHMAHFKAVEEPLNLKISKFYSKIRNIRVGSEYDQKEQVFRNLAGALGPMSEPTLAYNVYSNEVLNFSFVWINPIQSIKAIQNVSISEGNTANFVKPNLHTPLLPGFWIVKLMTNDGHIISSVKFLILPLQYYQGSHISFSQARIVNTQSSVEGAEQIDENEKSNPRLILWIDKLVSTIYKVQDICIEKEMNDVLLSRWPDYAQLQKRNRFGSGETFEASLCKDTAWSSLFPDPKSQIDGIDPVGGRLLPQ